MDEDEDTRLIADNPGYPVAVVPTQSSMTAELCWVNNKITLGSKPVHTENNQNSVLNPAEKINKENICKHCNIEFANSNLLIKHLLELVSSVKKPVKRKITKAKTVKQCQLSKKSNVNDKALKRKKYTSASEDNCNVKSQVQVEPRTSNNDHLIQQTSSSNTYSAFHNISNKIYKVRSNLENNKSTEKVRKISYIYKCKKCNTYFGNKRQMKQHKVGVHPDLEEIFVKLPTTKKKRNKTEHKILSVKAKKVTVSKKTRKILKNDQIQEPLSYRPEVKESLSMQNKAGPSWQYDTVNKTQVVANPLIKKVTLCERIPKKHPVKNIQKVTSLNNHNETHSPVRVINSEKTELFKSNCGLHFITYKSLQKHSESCNDSCNTPKINCKKCGYLFSSDSLEIHASRHHNNDQINIFDIVDLSQKHNLLQCISCNQKFTYKKSYQTHVLKCKYKISTQNLSNLKVLYKCHQCNLHYTTRVGLKYHLKKNHLIRYAIKKCDDCNILLSNRSFEYHLHIHHDVFECELKDLTIKCNDSKDEKLQNKINTSKTQTIKTGCQSLASDSNHSFHKNNIKDSTSKDFLITNDNMEIQSRGKKTTKICNEQNYNAELASVEKSPETYVQNLEVYNKAESVKLIAEAWIRNKCTETTSFASIDPTFFNNLLYRCPKCTLNFLNSGQLKSHASQCKGDSFDWAQCSICCYSFGTSSLTLHIYVHHAKLGLKRENFVITSPESSVDSQKQLTNVHMKAKISSTGENKNVNKQVNEVISDDTEKEGTVTKIRIDSNMNLADVIDLVSSQGTENADVTNGSGEVTAAEKYIDSNPDIIDLVSSQETEDAEVTDGSGGEVIAVEKHIDSNPDINVLISSLETKESLLSDFKSSRAKIAWAIDTIEHSNNSDSIKSPKKWDEEISRTNITSSNDIVQDLSNDGARIREMTNKTEKITIEVENDVSEQIDSILSALDGNSKKQNNVNSISPSNQMKDTVEDLQTNKVFEDIDSLVASFDKNAKATKQQQQKIFLYKCNICCIHFMTSKSLQIHILKGVHNYPGTNCSICHLTFNKHTVTKHITKHHEKMNMTPLNYTIKTNSTANSTIKRLQMVSHNKKQLNENVLKYAENMAGLTRKQKSSLCKVLKKSAKKNTPTTEVPPGSSKQTQNPLLKQLLNALENIKKTQNVDKSVSKRQQHKEFNDDIILSNSNCSTLNQNSNPSLEIIDLSDSQNSEVGVDMVTSKAHPQLLYANNAQSPNKRKFSVDSNIANNKKTTTVRKVRTKSEDQRDSKSQTSQRSGSSEIVKININTSSDGKTEKSVNIVKENIFSNDESASVAQCHSRLSEVDIVPINSKVSANVETNQIRKIIDARHNSIVQNTITKSLSYKNTSATNSNPNSLETPDKSSTSLQSNAVIPSLTISKVSLEKVGVMDDTTKRQNENLLKNMPQVPTKHALKNMFENPVRPEISISLKDSAMTVDETRARNCQNSKRVDNTKPCNTVMIDSSCITKPDSSRAFANFEDTNCKFGPHYGNGNANKRAVEKGNTENHKNLKKLKRKSQDIQRDGKCSSSIATLPRSSNNIHRQDPVDIIDITDETNDSNTHVPETDSTKNLNAEYSDTRIGAEKNIGAFNGGRNGGMSASTIEADVSNTPMAFPSVPNFNLFDFMNTSLFHYLSLPLHQQSGFNSPNPTHTPPKKKRMSKKPSAPRVSNIFDSMQSCPICGCSSAVSSIKKHLTVTKGFFWCCLCARRSAELELNNHIQICGSRINLNSYR